RRRRCGRTHAARAAVPKVENWLDATVGKPRRNDRNEDVCPFGSPLSVLVIEYEIGLVQQRPLDVLGRWRLALRSAVSQQLRLLGVGRVTRQSIQEELRDDLFVSQIRIGEQFSYRRWDNRLARQLYLTALLNSIGYEGVVHQGQGLKDRGVAGPQSRVAVATQEGVQEPAVAAGCVRQLHRPFGRSDELARLIRDRVTDDRYVLARSVTICRYGRLPCRLDYGVVNLFGAQAAGVLAGIIGNIVDFPFARVSRR